MQTIGISGGSGFVGKHLTALLVSKGYRVIIFSRSAKNSDNNQVIYSQWDIDKQICNKEDFGQLDAVVSLAGAGIADKRLTEVRKKEIIDSRVKTTEFLLSCIARYAPNCKTFVAASATGYYGADKDGYPPFTEDAPPATDFLGHTCKLWEEASMKATPAMRTAIIRIGIVLGKDGGAYPRLAGPLSFGVMPILGSGRQVISWIAIDDLVRFFTYALEHPQISGIYNGVAPAPVTHRELMHTIRHAKKGIVIPAPVPAFVLKILVGEMADEVLKSCTVSAQKTLGSGFTFDCPDVASAINRLV